MRRKLSALIVSAAVCLIAATAGAGEVPLFGSEILRDGANFTVHQGTFTPAADGKTAVMNHPAGRWSALYRMQKLPQLPSEKPVEFVYKVRAKLLGDPANFKTTMLFTYFFDGTGKKINVADPAQAFFKKSNEPQSFEVVGQIPEGAAAIRVEINSHGALDAEIEEFSLALRSPDLSEESLYGVMRVDRQSLDNTNFWKSFESQFTPAKDGAPARLTFPVGKWSALIGVSELDPKFSGSVVLKASCRWVGDYEAAKYTSVSILFYNAERKTMKLPPNDSDHGVLRKTGDWQEFTLEAEVPKGAVSVRIDFSSHGGGTIEIRDVELRLRGIGLTEAAVRGIELPGFVPPARKAAKAEAGRAEVECFAEVPFDQAAPFWAERPEYTIPNTRQNKSPLQPDDNKASFRLAADRENLYVFFRAADDMLNFKSEQVYERDAFEFFLMPTGRFRNARSRIRQEQYTITRDEAGKTVVKNCTGRSRLVDGGWEALMKIPLVDETRRITPFSGLELTFNASYQDADQLMQEHWLSFSPHDQTSMSWSEPSLYVPLVFVSQLALPYTPLWLGDAAEYNVAAKFPGRINLIEYPEKMENISFWGSYPEAKVTADGILYRVVYPAYQTAPVRPLLPVFSVLPGEEIEFEYEGRVSSGSVPAPSGSFLAQTNWEQFPFRYTSAERNLGPEWTRISFRGKVPEKFRENIRSGRILLNWGDHPGRTLEIRNFKITRRLPVDFDARIDFKGLYAHLRLGEPGGATFLFDTPQPRKVRLTVEAKPFFGGESPLRQEKELELPAGRSSFDWDLTSLPAGFFNLLLKVRTPEGEFLADRERYVAKYIPADRTDPRSGIWLHNLIDLTPPVDFAAIAAEFKALGEGIVYIGDMDFFDSRNQPYAVNPADAAAVFREAGFKVGSLITRGNRFVRRARLLQPDDLPEYFRRCLAQAKGTVDYWNFCNETNLDGGWSPSADAREWISFYRPFSNAVAKYAPQSTVVLGNLNRIPIEFMQDFHRQNGNAFASGVIGVHLYGVEYNGNGFENLLAARNEYEKCFPGWKVWDMESGSVFHSFGMLTEMLTKKMPIHLAAGVEMSIFYNDRDFMLPGADATPLVAVEAFKNRFYRDAAAVGRVVLADGAVHVYLFRRPDGSGSAALWNITPSPVEFTLPGSAGSAGFDQFGNPLPEASGDRKLKLADRFVRYFDRIDLAKFTGQPTFLAAFRSSVEVPQRPAADVVETVYVTPANVTRKFDHRLAAGQTARLELVCRNDGEAAVELVPQVRGIEKLAFTFDPATLRLEPGESKPLTLAVTSTGDFTPGELEVGGTLGDGRKLVPTVFRVEPAPPISVEGFSRSIVVRNNSDRETDIELTPSSQLCFFTPDVIRFAGVRPGESRRAEIVLTRNDRNNRFTGSRPEIYDIRVKWAGGEFTTEGVMVPFLPESLSGSIDFGKLDRTIENDGLQMDYQLFGTGKELRLAARIHDGTPVQTREKGDIRTGGDVLIIALSDGDSYREYGFSTVADRSHAYRWDGRYGVETAVDAADRIKILKRTGEWIDLDVTIPLDGMKPGCGLSIRVVDRDSAGRDRIVELGSGIVPRDAGRMGVLVK